MARVRVLLTFRTMSKTISDERLESYARVLIDISDAYGVRDVPEINQGLEMLLDSISKYRASVSAGVYDLDAEGNAERKLMLSLFCSKFKEAYGIEYPGKVSPGDMRMIGMAVSRVREIGVTVPDYIEWVFGDFLNDNPRMKMTQIKTLASEYFLNSFALYANESGLVKARRAEAAKAAELVEISARVREIKRVCGDSRPDVIEKVRTAVELYKDGKLDGTRLLSSLGRLVGRLSSDSSSSAVESTSGTEGT